MNLDEFLLQFKQTTDYPTLDGMKYIMKKLNNPEKHIKFIHVAGTNGKGSICEMLNAIFINSNMVTGKFISPHLIHSNESICINNIQITNSEFNSYLPIFQKIINDYKLESNREFTRFEILTSIAILHFFNKKCNIAILEVGLGGLYDCTNIITPLISVFGSISFDHTNILGSTVKEIATQKAGIIKENSNSVIFEQEALDVIKQTCISKNNTLFINTSKDITNYSIDKNYQYFTYKNNYNLCINLKGKKQLENASNVITCIETLNQKYNFNISKNIIESSLKSIFHPARFEKISNNPIIIFDGAHNMNAIENFLDTIKNSYPDNKKTFVISIITTKDYKEILNLIIKEFPNSNFIFTNGNNIDKFWNPEILYNEASKILKSNKNISISSLNDALLNLSSDNINFVVGSFYSYKSVKEILNTK